MNPSSLTPAQLQYLQQIQLQQQQQQRSMMQQQTNMLDWRTTFPEASRTKSIQILLQTVYECLPEHQKTQQTQEQLMKGAMQFENTEFQNAATQEIYFQRIQEKLINFRQRNSAQSMMGQGTRMMNQTPVMATNATNLNNQTAKPLTMNMAQNDMNNQFNNETLNPYAGLQRNAQIVETQNAKLNQMPIRQPQVNTMQFSVPKPTNQWPGTTSTLNSNFPVASFSANPVQNNASAKAATHTPIGRDPAIVRELNQVYSSQRKILLI
jgi:hypothetical protein